MTTLRQQMIDELTLRGYSPRTHECYLRAVTQISNYYHRSPDKLTVKEIQEWLLYLLQVKGLSNSSCRLYINALRFLFINVLKRNTLSIPIKYPKQAQRIPELLTHEEVFQILNACENDKHQMMLATCYGCGLRVSELVNLKVQDIDGERSLLHIRQGKGAKDRMVAMGPTLLKQLRSYWKQYRPNGWLFPSSHRSRRPLVVTTPQKAFVRAKRQCGIKKIGGIHSLRHAYATHQLAAGLSVHQLKQMLGHQDIHSTLRYVHWLPNYQEGSLPASDLLAVLGHDDEH